jgi:hypothetical protein
MWKEKDVNSNFLGFTAGELKAWNLIQPSIDIYSSYVRGASDDSNVLESEKNEVIEKVLNKHFNNFDELVIRTVRRMANDGDAIYKYTPYGVELIDVLQIFPIYNGEVQVGTIRVYTVGKYDPMVNDNNVPKSKDYVYTEIWLPSKELLESGEGDFNLYKFINKTQIEADTIIAPYPFDPHIVVPNKKREFGKLDCNGTDVSDTEQIIEIQDDWNAYQTDIGIINRQVAFPLFRTVSALWEKIIDGTLDGDAMRKELEKVSIRAGAILNAPIERVESNGLPSSSIAYTEAILEQLYRVTGIPKSVFVSDGGSNVAAETVMYQMESLRRRIDEKRTNIEQAIKTYSKMVAVMEKVKIDLNELEDAVVITWAEILGQGKKERSDIIIAGTQAEIFPKPYALEKLLSLIGDSEKYTEVLGQLMENNMSDVISIEMQKLRQEVEGEKNAEILKRDQQIEEAKKERGMIVDEMTKLLED